MPEANVPDAVIGCEHSDLDGIGSDVAEEDAQLVEKHGREDRENILDAVRILEREGRGNPAAMDTEVPKNLEVGLESCPSGRVGSRDRECRSHCAQW